MKHEFQVISAKCSYCKGVYFDDETKKLTQKELDAIACIYCGEENSIKYKKGFEK